MLRPHIMLVIAIVSTPTAHSNTVLQDNGIIVTATRLADVNQTMGSITVITADDISTSPASTLPEILATEAGVTSRSLYGNNASRATVDMRGFGAAAKQNTLMLLDGRRLNDVDLAAVDFSAIPLAIIERIEIIRGGGSVLYGDSASGGVINIITNKSVVAKNHHVIDVGVGSFNQREIAINSAIQAGKTSINGTASSITSDGYRDNNKLSQHNLVLGLRTPQDNGDWFVNLGFDKQELGLPGVRSVDPGNAIDELITDRTGTGTPLDFAKQDGFNIATGITRFLSGNAELVVDIGYRTKNQKALYDYGGGFSDYLDTDLNTWSLTPRISLAHNHLGIELTSIIGLDLYSSQYDSDRALAPDTINTPIHQLAIEQVSKGLYANTQAHLSETTDINGGARIQLVSQTATDQYHSAAPGGASDSEAPSFKDDFRETMWQIGLQHQLNNSLSVYSGLEHAVRFATVDEIYEFDSSFQRIFSPLRPQTANQLNLGLNYNNSVTRMNANVYLMHLDNEIHFDPVTFTNINLEPTKRQGIELSVRQTITTGLDLKASYSHTRAEFSEGIFAGNSIPLVPSNSASLITIWKPGTNKILSAQLNYIGSQYFDNDQSNSFGEKIPAYTTVDIKATKTLPRWTIAGIINNILDRDYFDYGVSSSSTSGKYNAYPKPGRTFYLSVSRQFL